MQDFVIRSLFGTFVVLSIQYLIYFWSLSHEED